jgi:hypothetical protein
MPCFFNGIFGHKPSWGIVPNGPGQLPNAYGEVDKFLGIYQCDYDSWNCSNVLKSRIL